MPISRTHPRRPIQRVTPLDASLSPRPRDTSRGFPLDGHRPPPQAVLDAMAEATLHKGFTGSRHPLCGKCFTRRSSSGACNCPSDVDALKVRRLTAHHARSPFADALGES
jgi:hypothetical protein